MDLTLIVILAIVQGLAEFLPISSSGHLVIAGAIYEAWQGIKLPTDQTDVNILLHAGTLVAVLCFYWREILRLLTTDKRVIGLLIVGSIPAVVIGLTVKKFADDLLGDPLLAGVMLLLNGGLLLWIAKRQSGEVDYQEITYRQALAIGVFQAAAIMPGLSRSGWTICAGLMLGMKREAAATFSFLLAIPVISGATLWSVVDLVTDDGSGGPGTAPSLLVIGTVLSFVVGLAALWLLVRWLRRGRLQFFAWWCIPVGAAVVIWQVWKMLEAAPPVV